MSEHNNIFPFLFSITTTITIAMATLYCNKNIIPRYYAGSRRRPEKSDYLLPQVAKRSSSCVIVIYHERNQENINEPAKPKQSASEQPYCSGDIFPAVIAMSTKYPEKEP